MGTEEEEVWLLVVQGMLHVRCQLCL